MRLLTTDELFAVSGGSIDGRNDPMMLDVHGGTHPSSATSTAAFFCEQISSGRSQNRCFERAANSASCPGGWSESGPTWEVGRDGIKRTSEVFDCKTDSSDSGDDGGDGGDDSGSDSGSDSGKDG